MRLWEAEMPEPHFVTDEQLLAYIASAGSLSAAAQMGDVTLVCEGAPRRVPAGGAPATGAPATGAPAGRRRHPSLAELMREDADGE